MTERPSASGKPGDDRAERLAAALRENLKKRKARARAAGAASADAPAGNPAGVAEDPAPADE